MSSPVHDFAHVVPVALYVTDRIRRRLGVRASLTASEAEGGWRIGLIIQRGEEPQTGSMSDLLLRDENPVPTLQSIVGVTMMDGVDDIVAHFTLRGENYSALFSPTQLRGMLSQEFDEPSVTHPYSEETDVEPSHKARRQAHH